MCSCAYLGLNHHPAVIEGAVSALREAGTTWLVTSTTRIRHQLLARLEEELGELFGAQILPGTTCSALTAGILPLIASGHLAPGGPRVMVFDRHCHFCMSYVKPICAEESLVLTCDHNDLNYLEDVCRRYPSVAYVADGAYSMGGAAALDGLLELQDRYGLFLFIDDSHSLSLVGERGEGFVRSRLAMNPLTVIVTSLGKGFGTGGGVAMLGDAAMSRFWPGTLFGPARRTGGMVAEHGPAAGWGLVGERRHPPLTRAGSVAAPTARERGVLRRTAAHLPGRQRTAGTSNHRG